MNVLVDTNVVLDVLLKRHPFYEDSFVIFQLANLERIRGYLSAASITDIFYIVRKQRRDSEDVYRMMDKLTALFRLLLFLKKLSPTLWLFAGKILKTRFNT